MFALVDCNNFYASCERVFRPDLNGKPIVVLSNNDGCVIARSNEAKAVGIPMGAPAFKYERLFEENRVHVFSANFPLYGDMSNRVMDLLSDYSPDIEIYSIDEAFIKFKGFDKYNLMEYGAAIKKKVVKCTGIPISIGIAPTKALSKVANRIAKKFPDHTQGIHIIDDEEKRMKALKWLKIEDVWGIGRQYSKLFKSMGVDTAFEFTQLNDALVKKHMGIVDLRLKWDLQGISALDLEVAQPKKNIATTRSFETNYTEFDQLAERIVAFASSCAEKLRKQNTCCKSLVVFVGTNMHREDLPQYNRSFVMDLPFATNSTLELVKFSIQALKQLYKVGYAYKRAGVIVQNFAPSNHTQLSLFENRNFRHIALMKAIDKVNFQYGMQKIRLAAQDQKRIWKMRQERLSPRYTTNLNDIITVVV